MITLDGWAIGRTPRPFCIRARASGTAGIEGGSSWAWAGPSQNPQGCTAVCAPMSALDVVIAGREEPTTAGEDLHRQRSGPAAAARGIVNTRTCAPPLCGQERRSPTHTRRGASRICTAPERDSPRPWQGNCALRRAQLCALGTSTTLEPTWAHYDKMSSTARSRKGRDHYFSGIV